MQSNCVALSSVLEIFFNPQCLFRRFQLETHNVSICRTNWRLETVIVKTKSCIQNTLNLLCNVERLSGLLYRRWAIRPGGHFLTEVMVKIYQNHLISNFHKTNLFILPTPTSKSLEPVDRTEPAPADQQNSCVSIYWRTWRFQLVWDSF